METKLKTLWKIFFVFLKISPVTFGGGYAMISLIEREVVTNHKWIQKEDIVDVLTIAQTAPGAIAINSAIFIGYRVSGLTGAIFALAGIIFPTFMIVMVASLTYNFFSSNPIVTAAFKGIGAAVIALIVHAGYTIGRAAILDVTTLLIAIVSIVILLLFQVNPVLVIAGGFIAGIAISKIKDSKKGRIKHALKNE